MFRITSSGNLIPTPKMAPTDVNRLAATKHQDKEWYDLLFPKDHVEFLVFLLEKMAGNNKSWEWPGNISYGMGICRIKLADRFKRNYTIEDIHDVIQRLFKRHCTMQWMVHETDLVWDARANKFSGSPSLWMEVVEENKQALDYYIAGDLLWCEFASNFIGTSFEYATDSEQDHSHSVGDDYSGNTLCLYGSGTYKDPVTGEIKTGSPCSKAECLANCSLPDSPGNWNLRVGSPSRLNPSRFASPAKISPLSVKEIDEEEWAKSRIRSEKKSEDKKKLQWGMEHGSPHNNSSGSSPSVCAQVAYQFKARNDIKSEE